MGDCKKTNLRRTIQVVPKDSANSRTHFAGSSTNKLQPNPKYVCTFCDGYHETDKCYYNPDSENCKLSDKAKQSFSKKKYSSNHSKDDKKVQFGGFMAHTANKFEEETTCLDSGATVCMFKNPKNVKLGSYKPGCVDTVKLAAGDYHTNCLGTGTMSLASISLENSLHVEKLNHNLVSVGSICDKSRIVVFPKENAVILNTQKFEVAKELIEFVVPRTKNGLFCFSNNSSQETNIASSSKHRSI